MTGAPRVILSEKNQSFTTQTPTGSYAAVVLAAPKGKVNKAVFVTSEAELLSKYTPNKTIIPGMDLGFYSALAYLQTGAVWVVRAANSSLYGGATLVRRGDTAGSNAAFAAGVSDMEAYTWPNGPTDTDTLLAIYGLNQGDWNNNVGILLYPFHANDDIEAADFNFTDGTITTHINTSTEAAVLTQGPTWCTGEAVKLLLKASTDVLPTPLVANTTYYVIEGATANTIKLATSLANALAGTAINMTLGSMHLESGSSFTLTSANQKCKTPGCFTLEVYSRADANSSPVLVETWTLATQHIKDGYNNNVFIEDVLLGSNYVSALVNPGITTDTVLNTYPKAVTGVLSGSSVIPLYFAQGDDGTDLTDDGYVTFLAALENPDEVQMKFVLDGGHATAAYQSAILTLCEGRKDCFGVLSVPYTKEASSDYLNEIANYRKIDANFDSSYGAMYTPHLYVYDKYNDRPLYVSPDGYAAAIINLSGWLPPFGLNRGKIIVNGLRRLFKDAEMDYLFDAGINPLRFIPGRGTYVWGDKTLVGTPSALDGINVRMVLVDIEPTIKRAMESFLGELVNDDSTRALVRTRLNAYLTQVKSLQGVKDWYILCDASNNTAQDMQNHLLNVTVYFKPYLSTRYIAVPFIITAEGVTFDQASVQ